MAASGSCRVLKIKVIMRLEPNILLIALPLCFIFLFIFLLILCFCFFAWLTRLWARSLLLPWIFFFFLTVVTFLLLLWMPLRVWVTLMCMSLGHFACADNKGTFLLAELDPQGAGMLCVDLGDPKIPITYVLCFCAPVVQLQSHCKFIS